MNNLKHSLKVTGIAALVMLVLVIILVVGITASQSATTNVDAPDTSIPTVVPTIAPTATVDIATLPAYQLAAIDGADFSDPAVIARYQKVLDSLHNKSGSSEADIASMTLAGQGMLTKAGYTGSDNTMIGLMDAADISFTKDEHLKYADVLGALVTLMENPS